MFSTSAKLTITQKEIIAVGMSKITREQYMKNLGIKPCRSDPSQEELQRSKPRCGDTGPGKRPFFPPVGFSLIRMRKWSVGSERVYELHDKENEEELTYRRNLAAATHSRSINNQKYKQLPAERRSKLQEFPPHEFYRLDGEDEALVVRVLGLLWDRSSKEEKEEDSVQAEVVIATPGKSELRRVDSGRLVKISGSLSAAQICACKNSSYGSYICDPFAWIALPKKFGLDFEA